MSTATTPRPRYLSAAQSEPFRKAGKRAETIDTAAPEWSAIAAPLRLAPGRYAVAQYVIKSGPNEGRKAVTLTPADAGTDYGIRLAAAERAAARWDDKAWIRAQRDRARAAVDALRAEAPGKGKGKGKPRA